MTAVESDEVSAMAPWAALRVALRYLPMTAPITGPANKTTRVIDQSVQNMKARLPMTSSRA